MKENHKGNSENILDAVKKFYDQEKDNQAPYFIRENYLRDIIGIHKRSLVYLQKISKDWGMLSLGNLTSEDLIVLESRDFSSIEKRYLAVMEKDLAAFKTEIAKTNIREGYPRAYNEWKEKTEENLSRFSGISFSSNEHYPLFVNHFTVKDGGVYLTDENIQSLKEKYCSIFINNPKQERFVSLAQSVLKDLNEMKSILVSSDNGNLFSAPGDLGYFSEDDKSIIVDSPEIIEYIK